MASGLYKTTECPGHFERLCALAGVSRVRTLVLDTLKFLLLMAALVWLLLNGSERLGYNWQWYRIPKYLYTIENGEFVAGPLMHGLWMTLRITGTSLVLCLAFGLVCAVFRMSRSVVARAVGRLYVELIRNTPLLIQIFFIYFVLAPVLGISRFWSAVLALSLFEGAYASEIFRAGIQSIHRGQWEAAYSLGLGTLHTYIYVILPQAVRRIVPPLTNQAVALIKDSALVSTIAVFDLTMRGHVIVADTFLTFEVWFTVAAIYLALTLTISGMVSYMEYRFRLEQ
ncbi:MAG: amino acid ABC transporter permease [Desulfatibacillaceae bacterium]